MYSRIWILTGYFIELNGIKILDACKLHIPKVLLMVLLPQIFEPASIRLKEERKEVMRVRGFNWLESRWLMTLFFPFVLTTSALDAFYFPGERLFSLQS